MSVLEMSVVCRVESVIISGLHKDFIGFEKEIVVLVCRSCALCRTTIDTKRK
jgi:hypothetical protein